MPRQPPRGPERSCTARRRQLRLLTAASSVGAQGVWRGPPCRLPVRRRPALFSVEKTLQLCLLVTCGKPTPRLTGRRHPLRRQNWKYFPILHAGGVPELVVSGQQQAANLPHRDTLAPRGFGRSRFPRLSPARVPSCLIYVIPDRHTRLTEVLTCQTHSSPGRILCSSPARLESQI